METGIGAVMLGLALCLVLALETAGIPVGILTVIGVVLGFGAKWLGGRV